MNEKDSEILHSEVSSSKSNDKSTQTNIEELNENSDGTNAEVQFKKKKKKGTDANADAGLVKETVKPSDMITEVQLGKRRKSSETDVETQAEKKMKSSETSAKARRRRKKKKSGGTNDEVQVRKERGKSTSAKAQFKKKKKIKNSDMNTEEQVEKKKTSSDANAEGKQEEGKMSDAAAVPQLKKRKRKWNKKKNKGSNKSLEEKGKVTADDLKYEENEFMTQFEECWVRKRSVEKLVAAKEAAALKVKSMRDGSSDDAELTPEETLAVNLLMKGMKKIESRRLRKHLLRKVNKQPTPVKPVSKLQVKHGDLVRFSGYWIKAEAAERLWKIKARLQSEGASEDEVLRVLKNDRRREEKALQRERRVFCYKCGQPGHLMSACTSFTAYSENEKICFKCGSTEHMAKNCPKTTSEFLHATCFLCGEGGHIARSCPQNKQGIYRKGGACRICESVYHLAKDCPKAEGSVAGKTEVTASCIAFDDIEALD